MSKEEIVEKLSAELIENGMASGEASQAARIATELGYRKELRSEWIRDTTYKGRTKNIYRCKNCDHYEAIPKRDRKLRYMRFCCACGALMKRWDGGDDDGSH